MPKFYTIRDAIEYHLSKFEPVIEVPPSSPFAVTFGQSQNVGKDGPEPTAVLRWGFSTWGDEPVIGVSKAGDLNG